MGIIDEIEKMRQEGMSEQEIALSLQQRGVPFQQIENALSQSQIKEAVTSDPAVPLPSSYPQDLSQDTLQASIMQSPQESLPETPAPAQEELQESPQQTYEPSYQQYPQYSQAPLSSDTITEIAEQVVSEKLSNIRNKLEKTIELKTETETKLTSLNERLQRIEKIIDRLELSILQKVGEYAGNVSDLKKELIETQKSFKSLSPKQHSQNPKNPPHKHSHKK